MKVIQLLASSLICFVFQELFGDVGPLVRASLQRPGIAEVVYVRRDDALRAVDVYHNRQLDGLPMHCSMGAVFEPRRETAPVSAKPRYDRHDLFVNLSDVHVSF